MNRSQFWQRYFGSKLQKLSFANLLLLTVVGVWSGVDSVKQSISYSQFVYSLGHPEFPEDEDEAREDRNNICLHADESRDVLVHSVYFITSLVILYSLVEFCAGVLLTRLVFISKVTPNVNWNSMEIAKRFWASYQLLLIILFVMTYAILFPLKTESSKYELFFNISLFILLVGWKIMVSIVYVFYNRPAESSLLHGQQQQNPAKCSAHHVHIVMLE